MADKGSKFMTTEPVKWNLNFDKLMIMTNAMWMMIFIINSIFYHLQTIAIISRFSLGFFFSFDMLWSPDSPPHFWDWGVPLFGCPSSSIWRWVIIVVREITLTPFLLLILYFQRSDVTALSLGVALTMLPLFLCSNLLFTVGFVIAERVLYIPRFVRHFTCDECFFEN
jgi:hypothetical protein